MHPDFQSLAYFMRRPTNREAAELVPFYRDVIGMPVVRDYGSTVLFWAGEDLIFEIKCDDHPERNDTAPTASPCLPIFRSHDLDATRARLSARGYQPVDEQSDALSRTLYILGPDELLLGFQERSPRSQFGADREALRRWQEGRTRLADLPPMPPDLQYLSRIVSHVQDVAAVSAFYQNVLGLDLVATDEGSVLHSLGDTVILQIAPGGVSREVPPDRGALPNSIIVRMHNFDRYVAELASRGARFSGEIIRYHTGTSLAYVSDPEGNLTGLEERTLWGSYVEDVEAERRWRDRTVLPVAHGQS